MDHDGGKEQLQSKQEGRVYFGLPSSTDMSIFSDHCHQHDFMFTLESVLLNPKLANDPTRRSWTKQHLRKATVYTLTKYIPNKFMIFIIVIYFGLSLRTRNIQHGKSGIEWHIWDFFSHMPQTILPLTINPCKNGFLRKWNTFGILDAPTILSLTLIA